MSTPTCPNCGAKFSWDGATDRCRKCLVTGEIVAMGPEGIRKWNEIKLRDEGLSKKQIKLKLNAHGPRRRNKHGRRGVRHA